jgi:hypothetical protein
MDNTFIGHAQKLVSATEYAQKCQSFRWAIGITAVNKKNAEWDSSAK